MAQGGNSQNQLDRRAFIGAAMAVASATAGRTASALPESSPIGKDSKGRPLPVALEKKIGIIGMKVATRGRMLSTWTPPPLSEQPTRMATRKPGAITMRESLFYNFSVPVSTNIAGCDNVQQIEENVKTASEFTPYNDAVMARLEARCKSIVNQGLYFRKGIIDRVKS